ncbi:3-oxoadipate enol-lactonase [Monaibacterium marinum]|uniref:3-oxoadipate enol-lactonase n=2 Tax=Pontivivens marinum TaxID=1690039 RepID=A0A2C9CUN0_9RHOB|nr:3-oxoadipate enol-lactonase [Monaibacterium marinum]
MPDLRGHGGSDAPDGDWSMRDIVYDVADMLFALGLKDTLVVGMGIGGLIAQALAAEFPQSVRAMVLIGTAAKLETEERWLTRAHALSTLPDAERAQALLHSATRKSADTHLRDIAQSTPAQTVRRMCQAVAHTDLRISTDALRLPTMGLVGRDDRITPPDLMREMTEGIPGAQLQLIPRCGHLTPYDAPEMTAQAINRFIEQTGHLLPDPDCENPTI